MHFSYSFKNAYIVGKGSYFIFKKLKMSKNVRYTRHNRVNIYRMMYNVFDRKTELHIMFMYGSIAFVRL